MITFMDWVNAVETMNRIIEQHLAEARSLGQPENFNSLARMVVQGIQQTIASGNYTTAIKAAAAHMGDSPELEPSLFGGKMRGRLKAINPNDQGDVIQNAIMTFIVGMPEMIGKTHFASDEEIDPDDLGSYFAGNFHKQLDWSKATFFRKQGTLHKPMTDVAGEDGTGPEATYEDDGEPETKSRLKVSHKSWNDGIHIMMGVHEKLHQQMVAAVTKKGSTKAIEKRIAPVETALAIMRNLPHQMAAQLAFDDNKGGGDDGDEKDKTVGDERVYLRLKSMALDSDSDLSAHDRVLLTSWAGQKLGSYKDYYPKLFIAAALWIGSGMGGDKKPEMLSGGMAAKVLDEDHWFYDLALDIEDEAEPEVKAPVEEPRPAPRMSAPRMSAPASTPVHSPAAKPMPTKSRQPTLFDDE